MSNWVAIAVSLLITLLGAAISIGVFSERARIDSATVGVLQGDVAELKAHKERATVQLDGVAKDVAEIKDDVKEVRTDVKVLSQQRRR